MDKSQESATGERAAMLGGCVYLLSKGIMCYENEGDEGQTSLCSRWSRDQIRREKESGGQCIFRSEDAGNCSSGLEEGTLDRPGRDRKGAGKANV